MNHENHQFGKDIVTFSGNSAAYNKDRLQSAQNAGGFNFKNLSKVEFQSDGTVVLYHYGKMNGATIDELRLLGSILSEKSILLAFGYNYTMKTPILIVTGVRGVSILPFQLKISSNDSYNKIRLIDFLSHQLPIAAVWHNDVGHEGHGHGPPIARIIDRTAIEYKPKKTKVLSPSEETEGTSITQAQEGNYGKP